STTADGASSPTERLRITNLGFFKASNTGAYQLATGAYHEFNSSEGGSDILAYRHTHASNPYGISILFSGSSPNNTGNYFFYCVDTTAVRAVIRANGGLANFSANNVNLSDRNVKKDIAPAAGTWDCLKEWEIVNFRYKDQPDDADLNMGVIAQQVAESCPEVITVFQEAKEATETEPAQEERIGVKEQQMMWMAIKALQEAQLRIETLEAKVAALEAS
ncbi:MAG: tail fiber domain-containing protein, partial [Vulcanococcus sp.]